MWEPQDFKKFKSCYLSGMTDDELSRTFDSTIDRVKNYLAYAREEGDLPRRGEFEPDKELASKIADECDYLELKLLKKVKNTKTAMSVVELANEFDVSPKKITEVIDKLSANHYLINVSGDTVNSCMPPSGEKSEHFLHYERGTKIKIGVVSDTHLGSKYCNYTVLNTLYDIFEKEGVENVYLPGNYIDGESHFNRSDLFVYGFDNQIKHFVDAFPQRKGITTYFIDGDDHEGWYNQKILINVGQRVEDTARRYGREDLVSLGYMEHDIEIPAKDGKTTMRIMHPGGGSAYALSYVPQKIVESISGGEKPQILVVGHLHKSGYFFIRNVHVVLAATTENQTPFMRKKRLAAHLGGWILEITQDDDGSVLEFIPRFFPFYDTKESDNKWEYKYEADEWSNMVNIPDECIGGE